ncbi:phage tail protein [Thiomicrorhabdus sp. Kp2]|uniref:phage tail protein n=1 Tax=Thiomicrorhabdus sp. Kp2 TaxID=1123518 RepID=UPI0004131E6B|nr:phage tail protein [Thiomicrorhabdus sp. Kp2]
MADFQYDDVVSSLRDLSRIREGFEAVAGQLSHSGAVMMMLGPFMFAMDTAAYQSLNRNTEYKWADQERIGNRPMSQFTGIGKDSLELEGVIYPHYKGGLHQIQGMRELAGLGKPLPMVDGTGKIWGEWAIEQVQETMRVLIKNGAPMKIEFRLTLKYYSRETSSSVAKSVNEQLGALL